MMTDAELLEGIERRVRKTIAPTFRMESDGPVETIEGRISAADFDALLGLLERVRASERERCASLHESVRTNCDHEPGAGAGAMGAVIAYRDLIRATG